MKRLIYGISLSLLSIAGAYAAPLSPEEAYQRLIDNGHLLSTGLSTRASMFQRPAFTLKANDGEAAIYVFDKGDKSGYMIVSADDATVPLLGYSDYGYVDPENMPPALEYWLQQYSSQIEYARENGISTRSDNNVQLPSWKAIEPLVKTQWNQDSPYNELCPKDGNNLSYTGCVATSMAQVMKYFEYPAKGQGSIQYKASLLNKTLSLDFSKITFDWANMIDNYRDGYTPAQGLAVATLMQACGYAVQMDYSSKESGAVSGSIGAGMVTYFNYDKGVRYYSRDMYTYTDWAKMIYDNLQNVGPVIYDGTGNGGGHSFIVDGYQGNGYFHLNWGWSGLSDGYYLLDALSPSALGVGGGLGGYNFDQGGVFSLQPAKSGSATLQNDVLLYGNFQGSYAGGSLTIRPVGTDHAGWGYQGIGSMTIYIGVGYVKADTPNATPSYVRNTAGYVTLTGGTYLGANQNLKVNPTQMNLEDGVKYKIINTYEDPDGNWHEVAAAVGYHNYFYLTKSGSRYTVENVPALEFSSDGIKLETGLYYGSAVKVSATFSNPNDTELTRTVALALVNTKKKLAYIGDNFTLTLPPKGKTDREWASNLKCQNSDDMVTLVAKDFYPALYDPTTGVLFYISDTTVAMYRSPGSLNVTAEAVVENAPEEETPYTGTFYAVNNAYNFNMITDFTVNSGYFTDELYIGIYSLISGNQLSLTSTYPVVDFTFLDAGSHEQWKTNIDFQFAEVGQIYWYGVLNGSLNVVTGTNVLDHGIVVKGLGTGVESVLDPKENILFLVDRASATVNVTGGAVSVEAYYLNGMKAPLKVDYHSDNAFVDLSGLPKGPVVLKAIDRSGKISSTKVIL